MRSPSERTKGNKLLMRKIFSRFLLPHCYSQRALFFVPRNLPCLISRAWVQCLPLRSSHLYLNQRPAKTTISTREGSGVAQRRNRRASLSTRTASCRCRSIVEQARCGKSGSAPPPLLPTIFLHQPTRSCDFLRSLAAVAATKGAIDMGPRAKMQRVGATGIRGMLDMECPLSGAEQTWLGRPSMSAFDTRNGHRSRFEVCAVFKKLAISFELTR
jgi:hypothetical protein